MANYDTWQSPLSGRYASECLCHSRKLTGMTPRSRQRNAGAVLTSNPSKHMATAMDLARRSGERAGTTDQ